MPGHKGSVLKERIQKRIYEKKVWWTSSQKEVGDGDVKFQLSLQISRSKLIFSGEGKMGGEVGNGMENLTFSTFSCASG